MKIMLTLASRRKYTAERLRLRYTPHPCFELMLEVAWQAIDDYLIPPYTRSFQKNHNLTAEERDTAYYFVFSDKKDELNVRTLSEHFGVDPVDVRAVLVDMSIDARDKPEWVVSPTRRLEEFVDRLDRAGLLQFGGRDAETNATSRGDAPSGTTDGATSGPTSGPADGSAAGASGWTADGRTSTGTTGWSSAGTAAGPSGWDAASTAATETEPCGD